MKQTQSIPQTFLWVGYTGLPLEALRVPVPQPAADEVLIRVAASSLDPLKYKLADPNFMYAPLRVVLYEDANGRAIFEYDKPSSFFGQFGDERVPGVGRYLDETFEAALLRAAG